ncbi:MAG: hypothetical protein AAB436_01590 [Patescibacteria group bacterium]
MKPQDYILSKLKELSNPIGLDKPSDEAQLIEEITRLVLSKKFRKYSVGPDPLNHIKVSIEASVQDNEPIKFTLPFGAYKLWRLEETPEADWAELFAMMYFTKWLKPICEIYEPGVWFDFYSDDVIIPRMNNIPLEDMVAYRASFEAVLGFIKSYQPENMSMTLSRVIDQYASQEDFEKDYEEQTTKLKASLEGGLPILDDAEKAMIELNVKAEPEQLKDPKWREKVKLIHDSYASVSGRRPYYRPLEMHKIMVVTTPLWGMLTVGSTKDSTMKFWVGAGLLRPREASFRQIILSPSQLEKTILHTEPVDIENLTGKNFSRICITEDE